MVFDVYERSADRFWSCLKRNELADKIDLVTVPALFYGHLKIEQLEQMVLSENSKYRRGPIEGLVIRRDSDKWCEARAKLVRPDFSQSIEEHWRKRPLEWNRIGSDSDI